jgi:hypothetical protein
LSRINPGSIALDEVVTRYILSSSGYSVANLRVKPRAFEPSPSDHCTSVFRIEGLQEDDIWKMGLREIVGTRPQRLHARADIPVSEILKLKLSIRPDEHPPRHALINGWSNEKHTAMATAQELAARALLRVNPSRDVPANS